MARGRALVLSAFVFCAMPAGVAAQASRVPCPPELLQGARADDPGAYAQRTRLYCDGVVVERHAGRGELPVIGVMLGRVTGDPSAGGVELRIATAGRGDSGPLRLQGTALRRESRYRLDALVPLSEPLRLGRESGMTKRTPPLRADDVAWAAWTDTPAQGRTYYPVTQGARAAGPLFIVVRPTIRSSYLLYTVSDASGSPLLPPARAAGITAPGDAVVLELSKLPSVSPIVVQVTAVGSLGRDQTVPIRVAIPRTP